MQCWWKRFISKSRVDLTGLSSVRQPPLPSRLQTLSDTIQTLFRVKQFHTYVTFGKKGKIKKKTFLKSAEFFLAGMKAQQDSDTGGILLGENTGGGRSCCGRSCSTVLEFGFQLDSYIYPVCVYSTSAGPLGTYLLLPRRKSGSVFIHGDERRTWRDVALMVVV